MPEVNSVVAVCENRSQAEKTMKELQKAGFDMNRVSAVADGKTDKVLIVCDAPWTEPVKKLISRQSRRKGTKIEHAA